jgi:hypothetical protein
MMIMRCVILALVGTVVFTVGCGTHGTTDAPPEQQTVYQRVYVDPDLLTNSVGAPVTNGVTPIIIRKADGTEIKAEARWKRASQ